MTVSEKTKQFLSKLRSGSKKIANYIRFPYLRINKMPENRPSKESIYFLINQLGHHKPIGLTHNESVAYHELPFPDLDFKVSRDDLSKRIERICNAIDVKGKNGVDLGCAIGGISFSLQQKGASMVGIERDRPSLSVAVECEALYETGVKFIHGSISQDLLSKALGKHTEPKIESWDFAIWLSSFNWVAKSLGQNEICKLLGWFSQHCDTLIMDSAIGGKAQSFMSTMGIEDNETFKAFILANSAYEEVEVLGRDENWYGRELLKFY
jgi:hypothetical protein